MVSVPTDREILFGLVNEVEVDSMPAHRSLFPRTA